MSNKLCTLGYFTKRLRDSGYVVDKVMMNYGIHDPRAWTIIIDPGVASVMCTCYINDPMLGESFFEIHDGGQFIPQRLFKIKTSSIEVFISYLVKFGINNKSSQYPHNRYNQNGNRQMEMEDDSFKDDKVLEEIND